MVIYALCLSRNQLNLTDPDALTHNDTDLVIFMTARPSPYSNIAAWAMCLQRDQYGRCTVGQFNWVPGVSSLSLFMRGLDVLCVTSMLLLCAAAGSVVATLARHHC